LINGFINIDKPAGITSHDVVSRVRRILGTRKVGHTGTLDPFATGVLPIAVNEGTKAIPFLDEGIKCYEALMRLGISTDTLDMTGRTTAERDSSHVSRAYVEAIFRSFVGSIQQIPPMYSAIKQNGLPLYKRARQGQTVERQPRDVVIHSLELLSFEAPLIRFQVTCSRGTYVRTLADDVGEQLGCGAALQELRRTASGPFAIKDSITLQQLESAVITGGFCNCFTSLFDALSQLANIPLPKKEAIKVIHGVSPTWSEILKMQPSTPADSGYVRFSIDGELLAVANCVITSDGTVKIELKRVFNSISAPFLDNE